MTINVRYRYSTALTLAMLILALAACGGPAATSESDSAQAEQLNKFKVAVLLPSPIDDKGWSQAGYEGLQLIEKELDAHISYKASVAESDQEKLFRQYAEEGYNFVIGHGGEFVGAAEAVAEEYPRIKFAVSSSYAGNNANLGALSARDWELGYLVGTVAGLKTQSNKIAFIAGESYSHIKEQGEYIAVGAKAVNPDVEVSAEYIGSWTDAEKAKQLAEAALANGVDVLIAQADAGNQQIIEAAKNAGVHAIGWSLDQNSMAPDTVVTSGIKQVPVLMLRGATLVKEGRWEGKLYKFGLREGAIDLAPFHGLLSAEEAQIVEETRNAILAGEIVP